jgi:predicted GH43/DUF377 family glycosyl hydrolase
MLHFQRLGVALAPDSPEVKTVAKFNAGMVREGDTVHMVFRYAEWRKQFDPARQSNYAVDEIRYARLTPEGKLLYESPVGLLKPSKPMDASGCQDARIVPFEGAYYLIYCGWDKDVASAGKDTARIGIARTHDFLSAEKLGFIQHQAWDKDAFIFPERIQARSRSCTASRAGYPDRIFRRSSSRCSIGAWVELPRAGGGTPTVLRAAFPWECGKVGGSVPPIRTGKGWLFLYHAVEVFSSEPGDFIYRAGVALLDLANPSRVIARLPFPILEPEMDYELHGDVGRVVFPVGGYLYHGELYISYGGADRVVALAKAPLAELLGELEKHPV